MARPLPGVLEGRELSMGGVARLVTDDNVVVAVGVEGRVEVEQVDARLGQAATQDVEGVA